MIKPTHRIYDFIDPVWAEEQAEWIFANVPCTETASSSGKFFHTYKTWHIHKSSSLPLIVAFRDMIEKHEKDFVEFWERDCTTNFFTLSLVEDDSKEMCVWHKDRYFINGQYHLTIKGNANIIVEEDDLKETLLMDNGSVWYFNSSEYYHKISTGSGSRRIELTAPMNMRKEFVEGKMIGVSNNEWRNVDGTSEDYTKHREWVAAGVDAAVKRGTSSNVSVAYPIDKL